MKIQFYAQLVAVFATSVFSGALAADYDQNFDGTWIGAIRMIDSSLYNPVELPPEASSITARPMELAIEIEGTAARVSYNVGKGWTELKPGAFSVMAHKTNAIVVAIDSNILDDESAGWVETWNLTLTHKDDESLYAYWVRAVNNYNIPAMTNPYARFFLSGFGELAQSAPIAGPGRITVSEKKYTARGCTHLQVSCDTDATPIHAEDHERP
jgi:hypothetical protein